MPNVVLIIVYAVGVAAVIVGAGAFFGAPYVPTRRNDLRRMFETLYPLSVNDVVLDIGSGDGVVLAEARRFGAKAVGYEINPFFYALSRFRFRRDDNVEVRLVNAWSAPFPNTVTLIYIFSVGKDGKRLQAKLQSEVNRLGRPLTLVCYGNPLPKTMLQKTYEAYFLYVFVPLHSVEA